MSLNNRFSGQELRKLRKEAGYTQVQMAERVGLSRETIIAIENESPGSIASLELHVLKAWWRACHQRINQETRQNFVTYLRAFLHL